MVNLKLAFRVLARTPFVTAVAVLSLGLGLGANAAIFSLYSQMILKPLEVPDPGRLVNLAAPGPKPGMNSCSNAGPCDAVFSYPMFRDLEKQQTPFTGIAAHRNFPANLAYKGLPIRGEGLEVSASYFRVLGLRPAAGRLLGDADDRAPGAGLVVVLSHRYWTQQFGADRRAIGDTLTVDGQSLTIVGVAPAGFDGTTLGSRPHIFVPITMAEVLQPGRKVLDNRRAYWVYLFARLKPGVTMAQASAAVNQPYRAIINDVEAPLQKGMSPPTLERFKTKAIALAAGSRGQSSIPDEASAPLILLLGVTAVVLLSACANIANLLLAKAVGRASEMSVRLSIGASRRQLIGQLLGESLLLAALGGAFGLLVGRWTLSLLFWMLPADSTDVARPVLDGKALLFLALATIGTGLLFGLFPALQSSRSGLAGALKGQAGQPGGSRSAKRFRTVLATAQIVLSMALLAVAGLFLKSLVNIQRIDLGVRTDNIVMFGVSPVLNGYAPERSRQIFEALEAALGRTPGVARATAGMVPLLAGDNWRSSLAVEGFHAEPDTDTTAAINAVAPGYFQTLGIPLLAGRDFTRGDTLGTPPVAIVNEAFAEKFHLGREAVGRHVAVGTPNRPLSGATTPDIEIIGLVKDARYSDVKAPVPPQLFTPYRQDERAGGLTFYVATAGPASAVADVIQPLMARIDPTLPVENLGLLEDQVRGNVFGDRIVGTLAATFAGLATILAAVGLYGVLAYSVAQRTREIGVRMALGADRTEIRAMVLRSVARMTVAGGGIGLALALAAGWFARALLYGMTGIDPAVMGAAAAVLSLVAFAAGIVPAWRASRVDPMRALRYD
jgi:predicted permease